MSMEDLLYNKRGNFDVAYAQGVFLMCLRDGDPLLIIRGEPDKFLMAMLTLERRWYIRA